MSKRIKLSLAQHYALGQQLYRRQEEATSLVTSLGNAYPLANPVRRQALRHDDSLSKLRSQLDDQLVRDHGDAWCAHVYYPGQDHAEHLMICDKCSAARQAAKNEDLI